MAAILFSTLFLPGSNVNNGGANDRSDLISKITDFVRKIFEIIIAPVRWVWSVVCKLSGGLFSLETFVFFSVLRAWTPTPLVGWTETAERAYLWISGFWVSMGSQAAKDRETTLKEDLASVKKERDELRAQSETMSKNNQDLKLEKAQLEQKEVLMKAQAKDDCREKDGALRERDLLLNENKQLKTLSASAIEKTDLAEETRATIYRVLNTNEEMLNASQDLLRIYQEKAERAEERSNQSAQELEDARREVTKLKRQNERLALQMRLVGNIKETEQVALLLTRQPTDGLAG